jgi:thioredoxin-like negative regulator of GroEL
MNSHQSEILVVTAPWCHHCKAMKPDLDRLIATHADAVRIETVDASLDPQRVQELAVKATPTIILRTDGIESSRVVGRVTASDLERLFTEAGFRPAPTDALVRGLAGVALAVAGVWLDTTVLMTVGAALVVWAGAGLLRWRR